MTEHIHSTSKTELSQSQEIYSHQLDQKISLGWLRVGLQSCIWYGGKLILQTWFHLSYEGIEYLPRQKPYLVACNHVSHLDGPAIIAAHGKQLTTVYSLAAKDYFFDHPLKGWICTSLFNMIPFQRRGLFRDCLPTCRAVLAQNKAIIIFPEGTRSPTGELQAFKSGLGFLSIEMGVPIVPAYIFGSYQALPKGCRIPRRYPIIVAFGQPIEPVSYQTGRQLSSRDLYQEIVNDVRMAIDHLRDQYHSSIK